MKYRIIVAEDEEITRKHIINTLRETGYEVTGAGSGVKALAEIESRSYDVLVTDIRMPGMEGLDLLEHVKSVAPETEVLVITGYGSISSAVRAIKKGAFDYLPKPFDLNELVFKIGKIIEKRELRQENMALRAYLDLDRDIDLVAESGGMKKLLEIIHGIQDSDCSVLLTGESGVGKNLLAKVIHHSSLRRSQPFLSLNCATFTEELLASELFGHEKGAFTGAAVQKPGLMEIADGGTLYFDEIAEMSPGLQAKLLQAIEDREFYRVGGTRPIRVDVRFIAATNQNLAEAVARGRLRSDLYYRLNVMELDVPPLRERREDIAPLCRLFLRRHAREYGKQIERLSGEALDILERYAYPGNVRELDNIIERAVILGQGPETTVDALPQSMLMYQIGNPEPDRVKPLADINKEYARSVIDLFGGNKSEAARVLGVSRSSLWRMLKEK